MAKKHEVVVNVTSACSLHRPRLECSHWASKRALPLPLIALHLVRHPVGTEARLVALFQLLVMQFGIRRSDGYLLPFTIPHSRLAELIGATRSTVTRQINALRQQGDLQLWEDGAVLFSDRLIEQKILPRLY